MSASATDNLLLERWTQARDAHAFAEIVDRHSGMVYGVCRRILRNPSDAEDVAQDCFIELARTKRPVRRSLAGWLHALAATRSLDRIRSEKRRQARESRYVAQASAESAADWEKVWAEVDEAIASLPETLRAPIVCRFLEGQSQEAVAQRLGTSRTTVQRRLDQGIRRIRALLRRRGVISSAVALTAAFEAHTAEAAPSTLTATLGKLALSGGAAGARVAAVSGGIAVMTKAALGVAAVVVAVGALWIYAGARGDTASPTGITGSAQAAPSPQETPHQQGGHALVPSPGNREGGVRFTLAETTEPPDGDTSSAPTPATATMSGRLVDSRGLPVGNGGVSYRREEDGAYGGANTDDSGAFELRDVAPGRYVFTGASYRTHNSSTIGHGVEDTPDTVLSPGEVRRDVVVKMDRPVGQSTVAVRVVNAEGEPIPGADIIFWTARIITSGTRTDREGGFIRHHAPDWEPEVRITVKHRDYETREFTVPVGAGETDLVMQAKEPGALQLTVVDAKTGRPIPDAEVGKDGTWQATTRGAVLFPQLSSAKHRIEARAPGRQAAWQTFEVLPGQAIEETLELFPPATARVSVDIGEDMAPVMGSLDELVKHTKVHASVWSAGAARGPLDRAQWQRDNSAVCPVSAGLPSEVILDLHAKTHPEDRAETFTRVTVNGLTVDEGAETEVRFALGRGTCVFRAPRTTALCSDSISLYRDDDRPGVEVENASHDGVSEHRQIRANREGMFVAGDLYPGTYRLRAQLRVDKVATWQEHFVTFTREGEELAFQW